MANRSRVITMSPLVRNVQDDLEIDLDLWEVVNPSDGEYSDDSFSIDSLSDDDVISLDDDSSVGASSPPPEMIPVENGGDLTVVYLDSPSVISPPPEMVPEDDGGVDLPADLDLDDEEGEGEGEDGGDDVYRDEIDENGLGGTQRTRMIVLRGGIPYSVGGGSGIMYNNRDGCYDDGDEDLGIDDGEYDDSYDLDEEIMPRNASRKLGRGKVKRTITKVSNSKKTAYAHLKASGARGARGKHGGIGMKFKY